MDRTPIGWVVKKGGVWPVRRTKNGDLAIMFDDNPSHDWGIWRTKPKVYKTEKAAERALEAIFRKCDHKWQVLSHEESWCPKCGAVRFVPDE